MPAPTIKQRSNQSQILSKYAIHRLFHNASQETLYTDSINELTQIATKSGPV